MPTTPIEIRDSLSPNDSDDSDLDSEDGTDWLVDEYYERRNILIYNKHGLLIAGLEQRGNFTVSHIFRWLEILYLLPPSGTWKIQSRTGGTIVSQSPDTPFPEGSYHIIDKDFQILSPPTRWTNYVYRCLIHRDRRPTHMDDELFRQMRRRDRQCLLTGQHCLINPEEWGTFESSMCVRIFPLMDPSHWSNPEVQRVFQGLAESPNTFAKTMQSPANAFIAQYGAAKAFSQHWCAIDVDDDYRIVTFLDCNDWDIPPDRRMITEHWTDENTRPSDNLLRWHFKQALIRWMIHDPQGQQDFITATSLVFAINRFELTPEDLRFTQHPGKSVFEAYMAQQLLGCSFELGNEFQDRFRPPDNSDVPPSLLTPQYKINPELEKLCMNLPVAKYSSLPTAPPSPQLHPQEMAPQDTKPFGDEEFSFLNDWDKESAFNVDLIWTRPGESPQDP
ncbi:hypothetical protein SISNIDRAFT_482358 [Sistotremastrum niveocremeum HHB9708]|uniref:HNH nuclease domain-containing protein n=1 Tax=Sistotremastrum niveocremeum HHB9708 TaxID=1314777 RepID=A0A164Z226_9AGAM|nr:hypothetical protein SISNIDRAFT_482358 [Sistotremastrum niveocremeum HHB9708]